MRPTTRSSTDLSGAEFELVDVADTKAIGAVFSRHPDITHCIHLAYLMSAEVEANLPRGVNVNMLGMVNMFEATVRHKLGRSSSRAARQCSAPLRRSTATGRSSRTTVRADDHFFTYGVMKILDEFMARKYVAKHGISIACTRPAVVFGHGRKRGSVLWAEAFATQPALGRVGLPFSRLSRDTWIYKDDCAEQLVRLALKPSLSHFAYNNGGASVTAEEMAAAVRHWLPDAQFKFDETKPTHAADRPAGRARIEAETGFAPRPLLDGVRAHINEARKEAGLAPV